MTVNHKNLGKMVVAGVERPFQVESHRQMKMFTTTLGIELDDYYTELAKITNGKALTNNEISAVFIWSALYAGAYATTRNCEFDYDDVLDWYEAAEPSEGDEWAKPWKMLDVEIKKKTQLLAATMPNMQQTELESKPVMTVAEAETVAKLKNAMK